MSPEKHANGLDYTGIAEKFNGANEVLIKISKVADLLRVSRNAETKKIAPLFAAAFVHPEIKDGSGLAALADNSASQTAAMASHLLKSYVPDSRPRNPAANPVVRLVEDWRAGFILNISEGQRMGEGRDVETSSYGNERFAEQADRLIDEIESVDPDTGDYTYGTSSELASQGVDSDTVPGYRQDSVFGYTDGDTAGGLVKVDGKTMDYLRTLERWFYFAASNPAGRASAPADSSVKEFTRELLSGLGRLSKDGSVRKLVDSLNGAFGSPSVAGHALPGESMAGSFGAMLAALYIRPNVAAEAVRRAVDSGSVDGAVADDALAKIAALRKELTSNTDVELKNYRSNTVRETVKDICKESGNSDTATELMMALSTGLRPSPVLAGLLGTGENNTKLNRTAVALGTILDNPGYMELVGADPDSVPDADSDAAEARKMELERRAVDAAHGEMNDIVPPFDTARESLRKLGSDSATTSGEGTMYRMEPGEGADVTGAHILPRFQVPLFTRTLKVPSSSMKAEALILKEGTVLAVYAIIRMADRQFGTDSAWVKLVSEGDDSRADAVPSFAHTDKADFDSMTREIEDYLAKLAMTEEPAVAVNTRNDWVDILTTDSKWEQVASALGEYIAWRADDIVSRHPAQAAAFDKVKEQLYGELDAIRTHVMRNVFEIRERCRDFRVNDTLLVRQSSPLSPFNLERLGRLRLSGGEDETVTGNGKALAELTGGTVDGVRESRDGNRYTVSLRLARDGVTETVTESERKNWMPPGLVMGRNSANDNSVYSLWVGLDFCATQYEEGPENTLRYDEDVIASGNEAFRRSPEINAATPAHLDTVKESEPSLAGFFRTVPTLTGGSIAALRDGLAGLSPDAADAARAIKAIKSGEILAGLVDRLVDSRNDEIRKVNRQREAYGQEPLERLPAPHARERYAREMSFADIGDFADRKSAIAAADRMVALVERTVFEYWEIATASRAEEADRLSFDTGNLGETEKIIAFCREGSDRESATARLKSAIAALAADLPDGSGLKYINVPFTATTDDAGNGVSLSQVEGSMREYTSEDFEDLAGTLEYVAGSLASAEGPLTDEDAAGCIGLLTRLRKAYVDACTYELETSSVSRSTGGDTAAMLRRTTGLLSEVSGDGFADTLAGIGSRMATAVRGDREALHTPLASALNLVAGVASARTLEDIESAPVEDAVRNGDNLAAGAAGDLSLVREPGKDAGAYNSRYGRGEDTSPLTGQDLPVDDTGERDDRTGDAIYSTIDFDEVDSMDTGKYADYSEVCGGHTMLGMVKCDPEGMYSETGEADLGAGLNPVEFETLVKALDSSRDELQRIGPTMAGAPDTANREYIRNKDYILEQAIDCFREFFASTKPLGARNVQHEADYVLNGFRAVTAKCQDSSLVETLREDLESLGALVSRTAAVSDDAGPDAVPAVAGAIATGFANVVLHMESYLRTAAVQDSGIDLQRHGSAGNAGQFMGATAIDPTVSGTRVYRRAKGDLAETNAKKMRDSTRAWLSECPELTRALHTLYQGIGLEQTINPEGAVDPFTNIRGQALSKARKAYENLYSGVAGTELFAALVHAISADEETAEGGYPAVRALVSALSGEGGRQSPVEVPAYVFGGADAMDEDRAVSVTFDKDGGAVPEASGPSPAYGGIDEVYSAAGVRPGAVDTGDPVTDLVTAVRMTTVERKLGSDKKSILNTIVTMSNKFDKGSHDRIIDSFVGTMRRAAGMYKGSPDGFVPLSMLYMCTDSNIVNIANSIELDRAYRNRVDEQDRALANRIMRDTFDPSELPAHEDVRRDMERHRSDIAEKTAELVAMLDAGERPGEGFAYDFAESPCEDGNTLASIMGDDLAASYINQVLSTYRESGKADTSLQTPGDALRAVSGALASFGKGDTDAGGAVSGIVSVLGPQAEGTARRLVAEFAKRMADSGLDGDSPAQRVDNAAIRTVTAEMQKTGDFTNLLGEKYGTAGLGAIRARRLSRGAAPTLDLKNVDGNSGAERLFGKTMEALLAVSSDDGDPEGKADEFLTRDIRYRVSPDAFVKAFDELWSAMVTLGNASAEGMSAALAIRNAPANGTPAQQKRLANSHAKVSALKCGETPLSTKGAGEKRQWAVEALDGVLCRIAARVSGVSKPPKTVLGEEGVVDLASYGTMEGLSDAISRIAHARFDWSPSDSDGKLAEGIAANRDDSVLEKDRAEIRTALARAYAYSPATYQRDIIPAVNAATKFRGVGERELAGRNEAASLLSSLADLPDSPVKRLDSDMYGDEYNYRIDGNPVTDNEAFLIVNSALNMYAEGHEGGSPSVEDIAECVRRCASLRKDYPLDADGVTALTLRTLKRMGLLKAGSEPRTVTFRHLVKRKVAGSMVRRWFEFTVPVQYVMSLIGSNIAGLSNSGNDWAACEKEIGELKYRNRDVRAHNAGLSEGVKNALGELVNAVRRSLADKCADRVAALDAGQYAGLVRSAEPVDIGGIMARPSRVDEDEKPGITDGNAVDVGDTDTGRGGRETGSRWTVDDDPNWEPGEADS